MAFGMNPQRARHSGQQHGGSMEDTLRGHKTEEHGAEHHEEGGDHHPPHIHIHHAGGKVHVHIMHHDQEPEKHEHEEGDTEGIKSHIDEHYGEGDGGEEHEGGEHGDGDHDEDDYGL